MNASRLDALDSRYVPTPHGTAAAEDYSLSPHLGRSLKTLRRLGKLLPNWDSYGALPLTEIALAAAHRLLGDIASEMAGVAARDGMPYHIAPLVDGGILLEWEARGNGDELAVDIGADGEFGYLLITGTGESRTFDERDGVPPERVRTIVADFLLGDGPPIVPPLRRGDVDSGFRRNDGWAPLVRP